MKNHFAAMMFAICTTPALAGAPADMDDAAFVRQTLERIHPAPSPALAALEALPALPAAAPDAQAGAWRHWAVLNPRFADAHTFISLPDWRGDTQRHLAQGGKLFPFEVRVEADGRVVVRASLGGAPSPHAGAEILSIDGRPARELAAGMLRLTHGDSDRFRRHLLSQRWWLYLWKTNGTPAGYRIKLRGTTLDIAGSSATPQVLADEASFDKLYNLTPHPGAAAVMKVGSFDSSHLERFKAFTHNAFQRLRASGANTLVIDISANGGGDDVMWLEALMPYLANKPYRTGSTYLKKDAASGALSRGEIATWHQPHMGNPLRFQGKTYVVIGPATYSSAVLFANVMQDFGFATLAGTGGAVRSSQTGGVRKFTLPQSGLALFVPRFVLDRPAGARPQHPWLEPDIQLPADGAINALLRGLR